jgi:ABC-type Fe3+ transport system substrate-binding protein
VRRFFAPRIAAVCGAVLARAAATKESAQPQLAAEFIALLMGTEGQPPARLGFQRGTTGSGR